MQVEKNNTPVISSSEFRLQGARLMTVDQVAVYTGLKERTIRDYVYKGKVPFIKINKMVRFDRIKIDEWIDNFYCSSP
ncbi:helix-turn-helix domain-containing protein [Clostridium sp.]|uniref:helix-turn-helix domain-containing protein n=1 Tax=Clostridium sp. TaxID=1506 RepID=UPI001A44B6C0|nr:helix-turn-helix domain-containing protein [Clostridium sp.]MBK5237287.1 helix-turn-helix domain-containing protein [Clostridium sp.]